MRHDIIMPALGMAQDTGTLLAWHKSEGEAVTQGETLFEVETDKSTMEVEAPASGFLVGVSARDGDEIPVGQVIAIISDTADAPAPSQTSAKEPVKAAQQPDSLPTGKAIIMPVLGMSQDSGVLVGWNKAPGDAVKQDDILFEVETDKSVVEVPAGVDGYLAARLAAAGDDVPTGETIAIISEGQVSDPVDRAYSSSDAPAASAEQPPVDVSAKATSTPVAELPAPKQPEVSKRRTPASGEKVLASPKLKHLAHQAGYDLALLAATGHPQPFHARDFEALRHANETAGKGSEFAAPGAAITRLSARVSPVELDAFLDWATEHIDSASEASVIAAFAGASLAEQATVRIDRRGSSETYAAHQRLSETVPAQGEPDVIVHDLRGSLICSAELPPDSAPVISIVGSDNELTLTLTCIDSLLAGKDAAVILDNFAGRVADPLRHLF
ncbi:MAG TPA: biotin/lipoyl-containing protein [Saccharospirillum sp.]|nr:biotin/lipoyl-containing protein [Saccharospirillum sp.]